MHKSAAFVRITFWCDPLTIPDSQQIPDLKQGHEPEFGYQGKANRHHRRLEPSPPRMSPPKTSPPGTTVAENHHCCALYLELNGYKDSSYLNALAERPFECS